MYAVSGVTFLVLVLSAVGVSGQPLKEHAHVTTFDVHAARYAEFQSSKRWNGIYKTVATPALLIGVGLYTATDNEWFDKYEIQEERDEHLPQFSSHADNYLQFAPIVAVYGLNLAGVKGKNDFLNRTALLIKSEVIVGVLTYSLKTITAVPRPDTGAPTSMPSGHTAQAFAAATFMVKEYGHRNILYSIGAYSVATAVGAMRVLNNRHWVSDVFVGAGVGIFSTNLAYLTHQYKWGHGKHHAGSTLILPTYDGHVGLISVVHRLN